MVAAAPAPAPAGAVEDEAVLARLAREDQRVATVAFRLLTGAVDLCERKAPQTGLVLHDARQFAVAMRPAAERRFGLTGRPAVMAVVPGSPAARAGIRAGDSIVAVDGVVVPVAPQPDRRKPSYAAIEALWAEIDRATSKGEAVLTLARGGAERRVRLEPAEACATAVEVQPGTKRNAWSDGNGVILTSGMVAETASDDELAAMIGHEIAHNILRHRDMLDAEGIGKGRFSRLGKKAARVRDGERQADYVGLYLAARAGYDPAAALRFWRRFGEVRGGLPSEVAHPGRREREALLTQIVAEIATKRARRAALMPDRMPPLG